MYLYGTFIGKASKIVINGNSNREVVESFLSSNPELASIITNEDSIKAQYKLMGLEFKKVEVKKPEPKVITKTKKGAVKKGSKKR